MKGLFTATILSIALAAGPVLASRSQPPGNPVPAAMTTAPDMDTRVVMGTVTDFRVGTSLTVRTLDNKAETFWLDEKNQTVKMDPGVAVGSKVKVTEKVDGDKRMLTVEKTS